MKLNRIIAGGSLLIVLCAMALPVRAAEADAAKDGERTSEPYPLTVCAISGEDLFEAGEPVVVVKQGREFKFCCVDCAAKLETDLAGTIKKVNEAIAKQQEPFYPLETCVISGEKLGSMGDPVDLVLGNRLVRLCCSGCVAEAKEKREEVIKKLDAAVIEKQEPNYPLDTCVIGGSKLGSMGEPVKLVYANQLVKLCCSGCKTKLEKTLGYQLEKIQKARLEQAHGETEMQAMGHGAGAAGEHDHAAHAAMGH